MDLVDYFSKLLNKKLTFDEFIVLTSIQKFRAYSWLKSNNINFDASILNRKFQLAEIDPLKNTYKSDSGEHLHIPKLLSGSQLDNMHAIHGVGIDIQRISEVFSGGISGDLKGQQEYREIFTIRELSFAEGKPKPEETLAGIFSAKEAIIKSIGTQISLLDLEILPNQYGRPCIEGFDISISHSADYVVAIAIQRGGHHYPKAMQSDIERSNNVALAVKLRAADYLIVSSILILFALYFIK